MALPPKEPKAGLNPSVSFVVTTLGVSTTKSFALRIRATLPINGAVYFSTLEPLSGLFNF
jgi:hypothetical protein